MGSLPVSVPYFQSEKLALLITQTESASDA
jgi:hypothetical protein